MSDQILTSYRSLCKKRKKKRKKERKKNWKIILGEMTINSQSKLETFTKGIPLALKCLVIKIRKNIQSMCQ